MLCALLFYLVNIKPPRFLRKNFERPSQTECGGAETQRMEIDGKPGKIVHEIICGRTVLCYLRTIKFTNINIS